MALRSQRLARYPVAWVPWKETPEDPTSTFWAPIRGERSSAATTDWAGGEGGVRGEEAWAPGERMPGEGPGEEGGGLVGPMAGRLGG